MDPDDILGWLEKVNKEFGRRPISHGGRKNLTREKVSIQGGWKNDMWNQYPKHMMEPKIETP